MFCDSTSVEHMFNKIQQVLNTTGLLLKDEDGFYYSDRVLRNKKERAEISLKRSFAGKKSAEARQIPTHVQQYKGKERKRKEKKETQTHVRDFSTYEFQKELQSVLGLCREYGVEFDVSQRGWWDLVREYHTEDIYTHVRKACSWIIDNPKKAGSKTLRLSRLERFMEKCDKLLPTTPPV